MEVRASGTFKRWELELERWFSHKSACLASLRTQIPSENLGNIDEQGKKKQAPLDAASGFQKVLRETTGTHGDRCRYLNRTTSSGRGDPEGLIQSPSQSPLRNSDLGFYPYGKKLLLSLSP